MTLLDSNPSAAQSPIRDFSTEETVVVFGSSAALFAVGRLTAKHRADSAVYPDANPPFIDRWFRRSHDGPHTPRTNFLDNHVGSIVTPFVALTTMAALDIDRREFSHDMPMFLAGILATKGVTDLAKSIVRRPRPYTIGNCCLQPDRDSDDPFHQHSFFSGHASSAFFSAAFLNKRLRRHARMNWTDDEYRRWRWAPPAVTFGWAGFVALSRVHADKHYFTDVAAGALVGYALAELFYHLAYEPAATTGDSSHSAPTFLFTWSFPID